MKKLLLLCCLLGFTISSFAQKRAMTTDDALNMKQLASAMISPDGESVIYGISELEWDDNKRETTYYYVPADSGEAYKYLGEEGGSDLKFSPDGKYLSLKRQVDDITQLFLMRTDGGEAVQLTEQETSVGNYQWSADSKKLYFLADRVPADEEKKKKEAGYDHLFVDEPPNGQREDNWNRLWEFDIEDQKAKKLTEKDQLIGEFDVADDARHIAFTARFENRRNQGNLSEIFLLNLSDSTTTQLTDNEVAESRLRWAPDSQKLAFMAPDDEERELRNNKIWMIKPENKEIERISGQFEGNIARYFWAHEGRSILFGGLQKTNRNLYRLDTSSGKVEQLTHREGALEILDFDEKRSQMLFTFDDFRTPEDLYVSGLEDESETRLTDLNPWVTDSLNLAEAEVINWQSSEDMEIEGIQYQPQDLNQDGSSPFLLHIHGGPAGVFTNSFDPRYHVWAGLGYVQLAPNVRGSSGYSDEFLRANMEDIGGGDYQDLMTGVDQLIDQNIIDEKKMAVRGWSYGGILGGTLITKTNRFKAASLGAMVSDWTSEYGLGFNYDVRLWYIGDTPWNNPEDYREKSPLTHAEKVETPTLFLHGKQDIVDTPGQSLMFFTFLKDIDKAEVRYIEFPREGHGFSEPRHQRTRDIEEIKWIQKHTLGKDWEPWDRKEEKSVNDESDGD